MISGVREFDTMRQNVPIWVEVLVAHVCGVISENESITVQIRKTDFSYPSNLEELCESPEVPKQVRKCLKAYTEGDFLRFLIDLGKLSSHSIEYHVLNLIYTIHVYYWYAEFADRRKAALLSAIDSTMHLVDPLAILPPQHPLIGLLQQLAERNSLLIEPQKTQLSKMSVKSSDHFTKASLRFDWQEVDKAAFPTLLYDTGREHFGILTDQGNVKIECQDDESSLSRLALQDVREGLSMLELSAEKGPLPSTMALPSQLKDIYELDLLSSKISSIRSTLDRRDKRSQSAEVLTEQIEVYLKEIQRISSHKFQQEFGQRRSL